MFGAMFDGCADGEVLAAYVELGALERAVRAQRLALLRVIDERELWRDDGATDAVAWVVAADGVERSTAVRTVEQARALASLPAVAAVAAEGRLSDDQLTHVCRAATPDTDAQWAMEAPGLSAAQLRRLAAACRRVPDGDAREQHRRRSLRWWTDPRSGLVRLTGRLTPDAGATVTGALSRLAERAGPGTDGLWEPYQSRCADALVALAAADADRAGVATVVVHTTIDALHPHGVDVATLEDGTPVAVAVARRLACDALRQVVVEAADGTVRLGRTVRVANHHQRRRLAHRDPTCRFPGCDHTRGLHLHHLVHWADGGATDEANLVHLCPTHHTLVHDQGWAITGNPNHPGGLQWTSPHGRTLPPPGPARPDLLHRYLGHDPPTPTAA
jgi:hypothetical protein